MRTLLRAATACGLLAALCVGEANAQCSTCAQPTVAYSPVMQTAVAPVVQTTSAGPLWYPGMYLRRLFGASDPVVTTTVATVAYQPTFPPSYSVGYAPQPVTVAYAPQPVTVGYAPQAYTAGYSTPAYAAASYDVGYRAVTLAPVVEAYPASGCSSCSGGAVSGGAVTADYYQASPVYQDSPACENCASQATYEVSPADTSYGVAPADSSFDNGSPRPTLAPTEAVPEERQKPASEVEGEGEEDSVLPPDGASYFEAPQLFYPNGQDKLTRQPTAPVWTAVYKQGASVNAASTAAQRPAQAPRTLDVNGWTSASP